MAIDFAKDEVNGFSILLLSGGTPVTGVVSGDVTVYASKEGGSSFSPSFSTFNELDSTNMPGLYFVEFGNQVFDTKGELIFNFSGSSFDPYRVRGDVQVGFAQEFDNLENELQNTENNLSTELSEIKGGNFSTNEDSLSALSDQLDNMQDVLHRILGLSDENIHIDQYNYDNNGDLTDAVVTLYPSAADLDNQTNAIATYELNAQYNNQGDLIDYRIKRTS